MNDNLEEKQAGNPLRHDGFCRRCRLFVKSDLTNCPLCGRYIEESDGRPLPTTYADTENEPGHQARGGVGIAINILIILSIVAVIVNIFINVLYKYYFDHRYLWSVYAAAGIYLVIIAVLLPIKKQKYRNKEAAHSLAAAIAVLLIVDVLTDLKIDWSIYYAIPGILTAYSILLFFLALLNRNAEKANIFFAVLASFFISILYLAVDVILYLTDTVRGELIVPIVLFILTFILMLVLFLFKYRTYVKNLIKKFFLRQ